MSTSYTIIGTGALGGYYGGLLARAGFDTRFLLHSDYEHVRDHGLVIDSVRGNFTLPRVQAYADPAALPPSDVTIIALKATQNHLLPGLLSGSVAGGGRVLVLQNGYAPERDAAAIVGDERVVGGLCFLCANKVGPGHIKHVDYGHIHLGTHTADGSAAGIDEPLKALAAELQQAGIDAKAVADLRLARWKKLMWNIPYNGLSVVLNKTTDVLMAEPESRRRVEAIMVEVQRAAAAVDQRTLDDAMVQQMLDYTAKMTPYKTSMMLDHEAGRAMEIEPIVGQPLRAAQAKGQSLPEIKQLYEELQRCEA